MLSESELTVWMQMEDKSDHILVIEAGKSHSRYLRDLWLYRELFLILAWRDIIVRYKQTIIGIAWSIIRPLLGMIVFTVVFGKLAKLPSEGDLSIIGESGRKVKRIGIISGGGAFPSLFSEMKKEGVECLVTGEFGHQSYHYALETGIPVIALGHYRSEIPGVLAVKELVEEKFGIPCAFVDLPTGF